MENREIYRIAEALDTIADWCRNNWQLSGAIKFHSDAAQRIANPPAPINQSGNPKTELVSRPETEAGRTEEIADVAPDVAEETADEAGVGSGTTFGSFAIGS